MTLLKVCQYNFIKLKISISIPLNMRKVIVKNQQDCKSFQRSHSGTDESCCRHVSWYVRSLNKMLRVIFMIKWILHTLLHGLVCFPAVLSANVE